MLEHRFAIGERVRVVASHELNDSHLPNGLVGSEGVVAEVRPAIGPTYSRYGVDIEGQGRWFFLPKMLTPMPQET